MEARGPGPVATGVRGEGDSQSRREYSPNPALPYIVGPSKRDQTPLAGGVSPAGASSGRTGLAWRGCNQRRTRTVTCRRKDHKTRTEVEPCFLFPPAARLARTTSAVTLALATGLTAPLLLTGSAGAAAPRATAAFSQSDHAIVYTAAPGQTNKVTVAASMSPGSEKVTYVIDDAVDVSAGEGCSYPDSADPTKVSCTVATLETQDPYATLKLALGDGDDTVAHDNSTGQTYYFTSTDLGAGRDTWTHTGGVDGNSVKGGSGADDMSVGEAGVVLGGAGDDVLHAAGGSIAQGGDDNDTIYSTGEDSAADGGAGDDEIHGGAERQNLSGGDGDDTVKGGSGDDFLYGGRGNDVLHGNSGNDTIYGNSGDDELYGGAGTDTLSGGPGTNIVRQD
ncbi:hypothetical protein SALBM135S_08443 [Streptomyces alboniger]